MKSNKIFRWPFAVVVALLGAAATFCLVAERSRARETETAIRLALSERSREAFSIISNALDRISYEADALPAESFEAIAREPKINRDHEILNLANAGFYFRVDEAGMSCGIFGGNATSDGNFLHEEKRCEIAERATRFADVRVPAERKWRELCATFFADAKARCDYEARRARGELPKDIPPEVRFSKKTDEVHDVRLQPAHGLWIEAESVSKTPGEKKFAGGFRFEVFEGDVFLVREIRAPGTKNFIQGFLLNKNNLLAVLNTKVRSALPDAEVALAIADGGNLLFGGLPLKFSAGTLPEEAIARAELQAFRTMLVCAWCVCAALCAGVLVSLRVSLCAAERRRIFTAAVVHDLRSPIAGMTALSEELLAGSGGDADAPETQTLRKLVGRIRDLSALLDNTLLFSRLVGTHGNAADALKFSDATAGEILPPIFERITERLDRAGMDFDTNVSEEAASAKLYVSAAALERILFNLADNAAKYAATAPVPVLTLTAGIVRSRKKTRLEIRIADNGPGLSAKAKKNLFREFSRTAQDATNAGAYGLGIGLVLSKKLAEILGGNLTLEKSDAEGTMFLLTLFTK